MLRLQRVATPLTKQLRSYAALSSTRSSAAGNDNQGQDENHPVKRSLNILKNDMKKVTDFFKPPASGSSKLNEIQGLDDNTNEDLSEKLKRFQGTQGTSDDLFQTHCDVLVIGGGGVGSSVAFWLKEKAREGLNVVVVERDPTVKLIYDNTNYNCLSAIIKFLIVFAIFIY